MTEFLIILAILILAFLAWKKFFQPRQNAPQQNDAPIAGFENPFETKECGESVNLPAFPEGRLRVAFAVREHCGGGIVIEEEAGTNEWIGVLPMRLGETTTHDLSVHGGGVYVGALPRKVRARCLPGSQHNHCAVEVRVAREPDQHTPGQVVAETTESADCGNVAYVGVFKGAGIRVHEAEIEVLSDCGNGVEIHRQEMRVSNVDIGGTNTTPGAVFTLTRGQTGKFRVQARNDNCYFRVTCRPGNAGTGCRVRVKITTIAQ